MVINIPPSILAPSYKPWHKTGYNEYCQLMTSESPPRRSYSRRNLVTARQVLISEVTKREFKTSREAHACWKEANYEEMQKDRKSVV